MKLTDIETEISNGIKMMQQNLNQVVDEAKKESKSLLSNAKRGAIASYWADAFKYGLATSAIVVPVILATKYYL